MKRSTLQLAIQLVLIVCLATPGMPRVGEPTLEKNPDLLLSILQQELHRATKELTKSDPAPYFISYSVFDQNALVIAIAAFRVEACDVSVPDGQAAGT